MTNNKIPTDFRRVTMLVNEIDPVLEIYHRIMKMPIHYDCMVEMMGKALPAGIEGSPNHARLVMLKANHDYIGMLGILAYQEPKLVPRPKKERMTIGDTVFVFNIEDAERQYDEISKVPGTRMVSPVVLHEYPSPKGGVYRLNGFSFFDPNDYFIECNQWLGEPMASS